MREPPLIIHGNVGPLTGDVDHDGDLRVLGSVSPGFRASAGGNLFVSRDVRSARLSAGGQLTVNGVVSGEDSVLDAVGSVIVRHAADTRIVAGLDVEIRSAAERCEVIAGRRVLMTGLPGIVRGGSVRAGVGLEVRRIESSGGYATEVCIGPGVFPEVKAELRSRIGFALERERETTGRDDPDPRAYRRRIADLLTWQTLAATLERRLRQISAAGEATQPPYLRHSGSGPVRARVTLGTCEDVLADRPERIRGEFALVADEAGARLLPIEEIARVG